MPIRVALFDNSPGVKYAEFDELPLGSPKGFRCEPPGILSYEAARQIAERLRAGDVDGWADRYRWYRQAGGSLGPAAPGRT
jgi:hypothetical protein